MSTQSNITFLYSLLYFVLYTFGSTVVSLIAINILKDLKKFDEDDKAFIIEYITCFYIGALFLSLLLVLPKIKG